MLKDALETHNAPLMNSEYYSVNILSLTLLSLSGSDHDSVCKEDQSIIETSSCEDI